jgi:hypothetical protein
VIAPERWRLTGSFLTADADGSGLSVALFGRGRDKLTIDLSQAADLRKKQR